MADASLGDAVGRVILDPAGVLTGMQRAQDAARSGFAGIGGHITQAGESLTKFGTSLTTLMAPFALAGGAGLKVFASFEDALAEIQARTGATADEMSAVTAKALEMGAKTKYSATDAASAMLQLLSSGYDLDETFAALPAVLDAAAAGAMDLGYTADVVTDALAMWGMGADQANRVTDALARGAGASSAEINDLADGLANVGPMAARMGLSIEDTTAILAAFSERGIKGAEAGTQLRSMLTHMTADTKDVTARWKQLGISMYDAQGNMRPLNTVMGELRDKMAGMSDQERNTVIMDLAGSYGQLGMDVLTSSDAMGTMLGLMGQQADAATVAAARMNTLSGTSESLKGSIETLMITALEPFVEKHLKPAILRATEFVNLLTVWAAANPELTTKLIQMMSVLISVGPVLMSAGKAVSFFGMGITKLFSPIGLLILAATLIYKAWEKNLLGLRDFTDQVVGFVTDIIHNDLWNELTGIWEAIQIGDLEGTLSGIGDLFQAIYNVILSYLPTIQAALEQYAVAFWAWLQAAVPPLLVKLGEVLGQIAAWVQETAPKLVDQLIQWGLAFVQWIAPFIPPLIQELLKLWVAAERWLAETYLKIGAKLLEWGKAFVDWVGPQIPPLLAQLLALISRLIAWVGEQLPGIGAKLKDWGGAFIDWVIPATEGLLLALPGLIADLLKWVLDVTPDIIAQMLEWATAFISFVGPLAVDLVVELAKVSGAVIQWVLGEFIPNIIKEIPGIVLAFLKFAGEMTTKVGPELFKFLAEIVRFILFDLIPGLVDAVESIGESIVNGIRQGIDNVWDSFTSYLEDKIKGGVVGDVADWLGIGSPSRVYAGFGENIIQGLAQGLGKLGTLDLALGNMSAMLLAPEVASTPALAGAGAGGGNVTNYYQLSAPITSEVMQQYPHATQYAQEVLSNLEQRLKAAQTKAGGGIIG